MSIPVYIVGGGGHAQVVIDTLDAMGHTVSGIIDPLGQDARTAKSGIPIFINDDEILKFKPDQIFLAMGIGGIGGIGDTRLRRSCCEEYINKGYQFTRVIHPAATISKRAEIQDGAQIMAGAVIQPGGVIGKNSIINTRSSIDHDCLIGEHVHIAPGVVLSGDVMVGDGVHIGTGATVVQGIKIGAGSIIGAGSVVLADIPPGVCAWGVPAVVVKKYDGAGQQQ